MDVEFRSSPDLQLAIDKPIMIAKASLADQLEGEMNKRALSCI